MSKTIFLLKNKLINYNWQRAVSFQNIILTTVLGLTNIYYAKIFHLLKIIIGLPYRFIYYYNRREEYYMLEICYLLTLYIGVYLAMDLYFIDFIDIPSFGKKQMINNLYNNSFIFASTILTMSSFINLDRFNTNELIYNLTNSIHLDNGFLFLMIQYNNHINNIDTDFSYNNQFQCVVLYIFWSYIYNHIIYENIYSIEPKKCCVLDVTYGNLKVYNTYHSLLSMISIFLSSTLFQNFYYQLFIFGISYIGVSIFTGFN